MKSKDDNPFRIPPLDLDLPKLKKEEEERRQHDRRSTALRQSRRETDPSISKLIERPKPTKQNETPSVVDIPPQNSSLEDVYQGSDILSRHREEEKASVADFLAKKREMLLLNMSIDTQKEEIEKLQRELKSKEEAIKAKEASLEESILRFDAFLKENDEKAEEAERLAEKESKKTRVKVQEIRGLNQQIQAVKSEIAKYTDALEECLKYKEFLDSLTPNEWFEDFATKKKMRQEGRRRDRIERRKEKFRRRQEEMRLEAEAKANAERGAMRRRRQQQLVKESNDTNTDEVNLIPEPDFEEEPLTSSDEECPMYFEEPKQLLDAFSALEDENLFLIKKVQQSEQMLHELKLQSIAIKDELKVDENGFAEKLSQQISLEESNAADLRAKLDHVPTSSSRDDNDGKLVSALLARLKGVYDECGLGDKAGSKPIVQLMLSEIESVMEDLLSKIDEMPADFVHKTFLAKKKERRERQRAQKQEEQERLQEERRLMMIERSMQPPTKRVGKPIHFRSNIANHEVHEQTKTQSQDELDEIKHFTL